MPRHVPPCPLPEAPTLGEACQAAGDELLQAILTLHDYSIREYGGLPGIRSHDLLLSAIYRPFAVFNNQLQYSSGLQPAAALLYSLVQNHPFHDGNKRTAFMTCLYFLAYCSYWERVIQLSQQEMESLEQLVLLIATEGSEERSTRYTVEELAQALDDLLYASKRRRRRAREDFQSSLFAPRIRSRLQARL